MSTDHALATTVLPAALATLILALGATAQLDPSRESTEALSLRLLDPAPAGAYRIVLLADEPAGATVTAWPSQPAPPPPPGDCPTCPPAPPCPPPAPCPPAPQPDLRLAFLGTDTPGGRAGEGGTYDGMVGWQTLRSMPHLGMADTLYCRVMPSKPRLEAAGWVVEERALVEDRPATKAARMEAALRGVCDEGEVPWAGSVIGPADDSHVVARCVAGRSERR